MNLGKCKEHNIDSCAICFQKAVRKYKKEMRMDENKS